MGALQTMELQTAMQIALWIVSFLGGWFIKVLFDRIKQVEDANKETARVLNDLRVDLPKNYTCKDDFKQMGDNIFNSIRQLGNDVKESMLRMENKIDLKADRQDLLNRKE